MTKKKKIILFSSIGGAFVVGVVLLILGLTVWSNKDKPDDNPVNPPIVETLEPSVTSFAVTASPETNQYVFTLIVVMEDMKVSSAVINETTYIIKDQTNLGNNSYKCVFFENNVVKYKAFTLNGVYFTGLNGKASKAIETEITKEVKLEEPVKFNDWEIEDETIDLYNTINVKTHITAYNPYNINLDVNFECSDVFNILKEEQIYNEENMTSTSIYSFNVMKTTELNDYDITLKNITFMYLNVLETIEVNESSTLKIENNYPVLNNIVLTPNQMKHTYIQFKIEGENLNNISKIMDNNNHLFDVFFDEETESYYFKKFIENDEDTVTFKGFVDTNEEQSFLDENLNVELDEIDEYSVEFNIKQKSEDFLENENKEIQILFPNDTIESVVINGTTIIPVLNVISYNTNETKIIINSISYYSLDKEQIFTSTINETVELKYIPTPKSFEISYDKEKYFIGDTATLTLTFDCDINENMIEAISTPYSEQSLEFTVEGTNQVKIVFVNVNGEEFGMMNVVLRDQITISNFYYIKACYNYKVDSVNTVILNNYINSIQLTGDFNVPIKKIVLDLYIDNLDPITYYVTSINQEHTNYILLEIAGDDYYDYLTALDERDGINASQITVKIKIVSITYETENDDVTDQINIFYNSSLDRI